MGGIEVEMERGWTSNPLYTARHEFEITLEWTLDSTAGEGTALPTASETPPLTPL